MRNFRKIEDSLMPNLSFLEVGIEEKEINNPMFVYFKCKLEKRLDYELCLEKRKVKELIDYLSSIYKKMEDF